MPHRPYGQHIAFMWNQKGYQEWELRHLGGQLTPLQDRFWGEKPSEELYDIQTDPDEVTNLASDPGHQRVLRRLRQALDRHLLKIKDNGFIPEGSPTEGYAQSRARGAYPLRRVMRVAQRAIERDPANLGLFIRRLHDAHEVVRYWAAQGVAMLEDGEPAAAALAERLDGDPSVYVRIAAAEALARLGHTGEAMAFLVETLDTSADPRIRLLALNALTYLPVGQLEPHLAVIERAADSPDQYIGNAGRYLRSVVTGTYDPLMPP
jgi:HEAT repeat protein